jgi:inner membrane protein
MNTSSHILFGMTLGGLSTIDPSAAGSTAAAVMAGTLLGSIAPDIDTVLKLAGKPVYKKYHRGLTHSLPAPLVFSLLLGFPLAYMFGAGQSVRTIVGWTFAAVCFHILLDVWNAFGVQCFWPVSKRRWHLDVLKLFDPVLFGLHTAAMVCWLSGWLAAVPLFITVYMLTAVYLLGKALLQRGTVNYLHN